MTKFEIDGKEIEINDFAQWRCILCGRWMKRSEVEESGWLSMRCKDRKQCVEAMRK